MKEAEQTTAVAENEIAAPQTDNSAAKDYEYWERKVADALRRVSQRLAAS